MKKQPVLITDAARSPEQQFRSRQIRYVSMMSVRAACLILGAVLISVRPPLLGLWLILCAAGMVFLPWAAVLIANLDPAVAGQVLELVPDAIQPDLLHRVARLGPVTPEAIETLRRVLAAHTGQRRSQKLTLGGTREAAKILQGARKATEQRVMPKLFKIDKDVARAIEEAMFVFDNLLEMDDKNLGTLIRNVDGEVLTRALKGVEEPIRNRFLGCMSARAADGIRDEMEARGPMKLAEVLDAQKAMIAVARNLAKDGTIQMGAAEDDYV